VQSDQDCARSARMQGRGELVDCFFYLANKLVKFVSSFLRLQCYQADSFGKHVTFYFISTISVSDAQRNIQSNVPLVES